MDKLSGLSGNEGELSDLAGITSVVVVTLTPHSNNDAT